MKINRRDFITTSTLASTGLMLNSLNNFASPLLQPHQAGYSLLIFATNWGFSGSWDEFCNKIKTAGYDGCEIWWPGDATERKKLFEALESQGRLQIGEPQHTPSAGFRYSMRNSFDLAVFQEC